MTKKHYQTPAIEVMEADIELQNLAGSVTSVTTTGLDMGDELVLPPGGLPGGLPGTPWDDAM